MRKLEKDIFANFKEDFPLFSFYLILLHLQ